MMSVKEYLEKRVGKQVGITRSGFPKELLHSGKVLRVESDMAVLQDDKGREWAIPLDKVLLVGPADVEGDERPAGFKGVK
jgi:ferredoxin-fold anticodon binding domain-containing protein